MGLGVAFDDAERRFGNSTMKPCAFAPRHEPPGPPHRKHVKSPTHQNESVE